MNGSGNTWGRVGRSLYFVGKNKTGNQTGPVSTLSLSVHGFSFGFGSAFIPFLLFHASPPLGRPAWSRFALGPSPWLRVLAHGRSAEVPEFIPQIKNGRLACLRFGLICSYLAQGKWINSLQPRNRCKAGDCERCRICPLWARSMCCVCTCCKSCALIADLVTEAVSPMYMQRSCTAPPPVIQWPSSIIWAIPRLQVSSSRKPLYVYLYCTVR